jgi:hypothetical protein
MTSKAERKRRKHLERKKPPYLPKRPESVEAIGLSLSDKPEREEHHFYMSDKQAAVWTWFHYLEQDVSQAARDTIRAIRAELTMEEFSALAESARSMSAAHRIGHSRTVTRDLKMSALRKLVIYCSLNGIDYSQPHVDAA